MLPEEGEPLPRRKKVDHEALSAPLMRIPGMRVEAVRALLDLGIRETYELVGRSPEVLAEEAAARPGPPPPFPLMPYLRLAVYYAEHDPPEPALLQPAAWT